VVRQALLELAFRSFSYVGDCVHLQMTAFARALPEPLSEAERAHFASLYRKQRHFGGLPFVLLHDRFGFLREAILDVWDDPCDAARQGVLLRLLEYYSTMVTRRREADRRYKARSRHRNDQNRVAQVLPLDPERDSGGEPVTDSFQEIATILRESRGASCRCGSTRHWRAGLATGDISADPIRIEDVCGECGHREAVEITRGEFEAAGRQIMPETPPDGE
jgi:hypothetical protein